MRRKDREITDINKIQGILDRADVLRIACNNGDYPYILPVNFGFEMNGNDLTLFFHSSKDGAKHAIIQNDNHVSFEVDCGHKRIPPVGPESCTASFAYESVIGRGLIKKASDAEKVPLLTALLTHYHMPVTDFNPVYLSNTVLYKIHVESYTAKCRKTDE